MHGPYGFGGKILDETFSPTFLFGWNTFNRENIDYLPSFVNSIFSSNLHDFWICRH